MRRRRLSWIAALLLLAALVAGLGWLVYLPIRQERLNHALIEAIKQNNTKTALALLLVGADANARDEQDEPAQNLSLWRLVLDMLRGKHPAASQAETCLQIALMPHGPAYTDDYRLAGYLPSDPVVIDALLKRSADPNLAYPTGETPLIQAMRWTQQNKEEVIQDLVRHGANVNAIVHIVHADYTVTTTPLDYAVSTQDVDAVRLLLAHGASPNITDSLGNTPLSEAKTIRSIQIHDYPEIGNALVKLLKQAGAKK